MKILCVLRALRGSFPPFVRFVSFVVQLQSPRTGIFRV
jgi:hypothetical protein